MRSVRPPYAANARRRVTRAAVAGTLLLGAAACADLLVTPGESVEPDALLFVSNRAAPAGSLDVFRMRADGSEVVNLTRHPVPIYRGLSLSPDGRRFLVNTDRDGCYGVWAMNVDGSDARQLTHVAGRNDRCNYFPRYSPDGTMIVLTSSRGGSWSTWVMNADGSDPREIAAALQQTSPGQTWSGGWTPQGRVVIAHIPADSTSVVGRGTYTVLPDGTDLRPLLNDPSDDAPRWSPDGSTIAFHRMEGVPFVDLRPTVYLMSADGTGERKLADLPGSSSFAGAEIWENDHDPWSPDGSRLVFRNQQPGSVALHVVNADGTGLRRLTEPALEARFNGWSPDGLRIAFTGTTGGVADVYVINVDGTGLTNLTRGAGSSSAAIWVPR